MASRVLELENLLRPLQISALGLCLVAGSSMPAEEQGQYIAEALQAQGLELFDVIQKEVVLEQNADRGTRTLPKVLCGVAREIY